jgi:hypothetical protein
MQTLQPKKTTEMLLYSIIAIVSIFSLVITTQSFAQTTPSNPGGGTTSIPTLTPGTGGKTTNTKTLGGITPVTPITPDINNEQIIEGTGTTTVDTKKAPTSVVPTAPIVGEQTPVASNPLPVNSSTETVRTGGLEIGLGLIAIIALGIGYYYYKKKGDTKSVLKTTERKIRF